MKRLKIYLAAIALLAMSASYGQQLILDGSCELGPGGTGTVPPDWTLVQHTPDNCESPPAACPGPGYVINNPSPDGGRWMRFFRGGGWNERFGQFICQPMVAGQTYTLEFWASHSDLNSSANATNTGIDYGFSIGLPGGTGAGAGNAGNVALTTPEVWQLVSVTFVATANWDFISFAKNTTDTQNATYIDGVSLIGPVSGGGGNPGTNGTISVCPSDPVFNLFDILGGSPDTGGTWSGPSALSGGDLGTYDPMVNVAGVYTYEVTPSGPCTSGTPAQATVTVTAGSADATITPAGPFCDNVAAVNLVGADPGGTWTGTGITNGTTGEFDPGVAGPGNHTITYTITGACSDVDTEVITVNASADATITPAGPFCVTDAAVTLVGADPGGTWTGNGITNGATGDFDPGVAGAGTHTITYDIAGACPDTQTEDIIVNAQADATITPVGPFCDTDPVVTLVGADPGGTWSGPGITNASTGDFDPSVAGLGSHTITYTIAGACGDVQTTTIDVNNVLNATITPAGPFCDGDPIVILTAVDNGGTWTGNGITNGATGEFDPSVAGAGTHTITYTIAGTCGDVQTEDITVNAQADATITPAGPFCSTDPAVVLVAAGGGGTWSGTGITNAMNGDFDPGTAGAGSHVITYSIAGACGDTQTETIVVDNQADATITPAGPFCDNDAAVTLIGADPGGNWTGTGITNGATGAFDPSVAGAGNHTITYDIPGACPDTQIEVITVNATDDPTINPVPVLCLNSISTMITAITPGGTWAGNGINNTTTGEFIPTMAGEGIHTITYTTGGVCPATGTIQVEVLGPITVNALQDASICEGQSADISATGSGGDGNITLTWTDDQTNNLGSNPSLTVTPLVTTVYTVTADDGCGTASATDQVTITVNPLPVVNFDAVDMTGCVPFTAQFNDLTVPVGTNCTWDFGDGSTGIGCGGASHTYNTPGCYDVTLTVEDANNCASNLTITSLICVDEYAIARFTATPEQMDILNTTVDITNESENATSYNWVFSDGSTSNVVNPSHTFPETLGAHTICLTAINDAQCNDSICTTVFITEEVIFYVPNIFTPDGDAFNETWAPHFESGIDIYDFHLLIFNRWGEVIWESYNPAAGWDGHYGDGGLVDDGVYVWQIDFKSNQSDERQLHRGHVTVLK